MFVLQLATNNNEKIADWWQYMRDRQRQQRQLRQQQRRWQQQSALPTAQLPKRSFVCLKQSPKTPTQATKTTTTTENYGSDCALLQRVVQHKSSICSLSVLCCCRLTANDFLGTSLLRLLLLLTPAERGDSISNSSIHQVRAATWGELIF